MSEKTKVTLTVSGCETELPVLDATLGHNVVDIRSLTKSTGLFAFDPGFMSTASCESKITYIDGDEGLLYYRGYPIEQLAEKSDYLEVCYLLIYGELPTPKQKAEFECTVRHHTMVHEQLTWFFRGFRRDAHPMAMMVGVVGALSAFYQDSLDITNPEHRKIAIYRLISKIPTIAAMCYRYSNGLPFNYPRNNLSYSENFMHMMFATPCEDYKPNPVLARALACRWGASHGGANEAVLLMLDEIGDVSHVAEYMEGVKQRKYRLMGFGHRVYRNMDPRASIMRQTCYEVLKELNLEDNPKFKLAMELEKIALKDPFFVERKLYPNVDFYSGIVLSALGIPTSMFTVIFALARSVGWISHWHEMIGDPSLKIGRPRQLYTGAPRRDFVPPEQR